MRNPKIYLLELTLVALMSACQLAPVQVTSTTVPIQSPSETATLIPLIRPSSSITAEAQFPIDILKEACQGRPVHEAGIYSTRLDIHPVFFVGDVVLIRRLEMGLPGNWKAVLIPDTQLVACLSVKRDVVEVCRYGHLSGITEVTITRYSATLTVRLFEAKTGRFLDEESFHKIAKDCPSGTAQTFDSDYFPDDFESSDIENWLGRFVSP